MSSVQLSLFSDDNIPNLDVAEINAKKKKNTGPLPHLNEHNEIDTSPEHEDSFQTAESHENTSDESVNSPTQSIEFNSDSNQSEEDVSEPENIIQNSNLTNTDIETISKNEDESTETIATTEKKKNTKEKPELSPEDIAIQKISQAIIEKKERGELTQVDRINYLTQVKEIAMGCQKCKLAETRTKVVFSSGNPEAPIMIIGEGPGENEDKSGIPFVGRAGQLLDKILASANIYRDKDIYITNMVKCRPPGNRPPEKDELEACSVYLEKQLELNTAPILVLPGATAKSLVNTTSSISKIRGEWIHWKGRWVMPVFHPSYLLRQDSKEVGSPKWLMWQDIKKVKQKFDEIKEQET